MATLRVRRLDRINGITCPGDPADVAAAAKLLKVTALLVQKAAREQGLSPIAGAAHASLQSVRSLVAATGAKCNLAPPDEDIDVKVGSNGNMIYRCQHSPCHEWDLNGKRLK